ncbi:MAG: class I SAM-dependent methyltransferase [Sedimentisphaerales bacterium]|nr:class I SAM-dependent methyltransferase [Sedimentisphaerales bacterium]
MRHAVTRQRGLSLDHNRMLRALKYQRCAARPIKMIMRKLGFTGPSEIGRKDVLAGWGWPRSLRRELRKVPDRLFSGYSLTGSGCLWLYKYVTACRPSCIVECGSGLSTVVISLAIRDLGTQGMGIHFVSLDHESHWLEATRAVLDILQVSPHVQLSHSPIIEMHYLGNVFHAYDVPRTLGSEVIDLLFVDGPPRQYGRLGVVPGLLENLCDNALIVLDDAERLSERQCVEFWVRHCGLSLIGYAPKGHGLALLRKQTASQMRLTAKQDTTRTLQRMHT